MAEKRDDERSKPLNYGGVDTYTLPGVTEPCRWDFSSCCSDVGSEFNNVENFTTMKPHWLDLSETSEAEMTEAERVKEFMARNKQVGGNHYKDMAIQPAEYCHKNGLGYCESIAIRYISRWKGKDGVKDLEKAKHAIELLIEMESKP